MLHMKFPPTTQQLEEAGFEKGQADALAVCFVITDQRHEDVMTLFQSILSEIKALKKGQDATNQKLVDFQLQTERRFSEIHASLIKWMVGTALTAVFSVIATGLALIQFFTPFGVG